MTKAILGIIGGSRHLRPCRASRTPSRRGSTVRRGEPSAPHAHRRDRRLSVVFLSRHDKGHRLSPSDINYRANIDVLKRAGVTDLISLSACGSFREELPPGTSCWSTSSSTAPTGARARSSAAAGVAHVSMAHRSRRACASTSPRRRWRRASRVVRDGTYVCMEGPQFSESRREPDLQAARLFGDRHDQHAGGQARARGRDLLQRPSPW